MAANPVVPQIPPPPPNSKWVNGPQIPLNQFHVSANQTKKFMIIRKITAGAKAGVFSPGRIAVLAQLLHDGLLLAIGGQYGCKPELKGLGSAFGDAQHLVNNNPGRLAADNDGKDVSAFLNALNGMFVDAVPPTRLDLYVDRIKKFDFKTYISNWIFPNAPMGVCTALPANSLVDGQGNQIGGGGPGGQIIQNIINNDNDNNDNDNNGGFDYSIYDNLLNANDNIDLSQQNYDSQMAKKLAEVAANVFVPSEHVARTCDPLRETDFGLRMSKCMQVRLQIMLNIQQSRHLDGSLAPDQVLKYEDLKSELNILNMRFADLLMFYRVYYMLKPIPKLFAPFLDKKGNELEVSHNVLWKRCWITLNKGPDLDKVITTLGKRQKPFPFDFIINEAATFFVVHNGKISYDINVLNKFALEKLGNEINIINNNNINDPFAKLGPQSKRRKVSHDSSGSALVGGDINTELSPRDRNLMNHLVTMMNTQVSQRDVNINRKLDLALAGKSGSAFSDSVSEMLKNKSRGPDYFCQDYAVGKDKELKGFLIIAKDAMQSSAHSRKRKWMQSLINSDYSGKEKLTKLHGIYNISRLFSPVILPIKIYFDRYCAPCRSRCHITDHL